MNSHHPIPLYGVMGTLPLLIVGLAIPMLLGRVKPNNFYGVRTPKTMASPELWYRANREAGYSMILATAISLCFWAVLAFVPFQSSAARANADIQVFVGVLLLFLFLSLLRSRAL